MVLTAYTGRVMYLRGLVEGAARLDLDGNPAGEVTVRDAEYAAAKLARILASREAAAVATKGGERVKPAAVPPSPAPPAATTLKRPVLRLPAFRQAGEIPTTSETGRAGKPVERRFLPGK